uniref:Uncharacterized protein n=1 Tax=Setaria viridis TaxID=4556 RepID=A0A4U6TFQ7_SETVI|nr:LOW QUALITY PROTEIN: hypothetical protein SEVIR_8G039200v2 [Setaria viridis]
MSHRRRILNPVTRTECAGAYSARRVDLHSHHNNLFYPTEAAAAGAPDPKKMERIQVPPRSTLLFGRRLDWFPLSESKMMYFDHHSRATFVYDAAALCVDSTVPNFRVNGRVPIVLPIAGADEDDGIYVMERSPRSFVDSEEKYTSQFQALVRRNSSQEPFVSNDDANRWRRDELPPPPYVRDAGYRSTAIDSCALAGGAVCVSTEGIGTYCFDTVEHVPELGVLVGFWASECGHRLCASGDLSSAVYSGRPVLRAWLDLDPPGGDWHVVKAPQLIGLGSGKFCVAQFFKTVVRRGCDGEDGVAEPRNRKFEGGIGTRQTFLEKKTDHRRSAAGHGRGHHAATGRHARCRPLPRARSGGERGGGCRIRAGGEEGGADPAGGEVAGEEGGGGGAGGRASGGGEDGDWALGAGRRGWGRRAAAGERRGGGRWAAAGGGRRGRGRGERERCEEEIRPG